MARDQPLDRPVDLRSSRAGVHEAEISGRLYGMANEVKDRLAETADLNYVINLGITLLHAAIGKTISFTDPSPGEEEVYRLWGS